MSNHAIYKYAIDGSPFAMAMPRGARILHVGVQHNHPYFWARVEIGAPDEVRRFIVATTGSVLPAGADVYVGTFQVEKFGVLLVGHLFEKERS